LFILKFEFNPNFQPKQLKQKINHSKQARFLFLTNIFSYLRFMEKHYISRQTINLLKKLKIFMLIQNIYTKINTTTNKTRQPLSKIEIKQIKKIFQQDIKQTEKLLKSVFHIKTSKYSWLSC